MGDANDFGSFAEAITALGTLNKLESAVSSAIKTSKVPPKEIRKLMKCSTIEEASNTPLIQFIEVLFKKIGLGTLKLSRNDIFNYVFTMPDSAVCRLYPNVSNKKVCYIIAEALQQFFEKDLGIPGNAEELRCVNEGNHVCEFSITLQPLAVYQHVLDSEDRDIIGGLINSQDIPTLAEAMDLHDEEVKYRLEILQRYHILDENYKVTEIGETYNKYGRGMHELDKDFPPPWKDMSEISQAISASTSFAEAFLETTTGEPVVEDVNDDAIVNLVDEAKKSLSFAELISKSTKKEDNTD
ncbi:MAG: hypothetical protein KAS67_06105 [Thermoplasmata archaeon]|nr:hypothetical protein [Thermoplasmata archaeon]